MSRFLYRFFFKLAGWKVSGKMPDLKKFIIIVAPHTSNWDFMIGLCARSILRFDAKYLGKKELFRFPFGPLFRWLGGLPVDRSRHGNLVDSVAELFAQHENLIVALAPEGTRKTVKQWKTGFYFIAYKAGVPIVLASFDYPRKTVFISEPFYPSGDLNGDLEKIFSFFRDKQGRFPKPLPVIQ